MQCSVQSEPAKEGATVSVQKPAHCDATLQVPVLQAVVASQPDALLMVPDDGSALQTPIEQAKAAGIKTVLVKGDPTSASISTGYTIITQANLSTAPGQGRDLQGPLLRAAGRCLIDD